MHLFELIAAVAMVCSGTVEATAYSCGSFPNYEEIDAVAGQCFHIMDGGNSTADFFDAVQYCINREGFLPTPQNMEELMGIDAWVTDNFPHCYRADAKINKVPTGFWIGNKRRPMPVGAGQSYLPDVRPARITKSNFWDIYKQCPREVMPLIWARFQPDDTPDGTDAQDEQCVAKRRIGWNKWNQKDKGAHDWICEAQHFVVCQRCAEEVEEVETTTVSGVTP
jgi:hypothetical protein